MSDFTQDTSREGGRSFTPRRLRDRPKVGYVALREYRHSEFEAEYFLTANLQRRGRGLETEELTSRIKAQCAELETRQVWQVRTAVVMPDHVHLLAVLGRTLNLADALRAFKGPLAPTLRSAGLKWQAGYYDRELRKHEDRLPAFHYIFLNPYKDELCGRSEKWPGYYCSPEDWRWFGELTEHGCPMPEWLK